MSWNAASFWNSPLGWRRAPQPWPQARRPRRFRRSRSIRADGFPPMKMPILPWLAATRSIGSSQRKCGGGITGIITAIGAGIVAIGVGATDIGAGATVTGIAATG